MRLSTHDSENGNVTTVENADVNHAHFRWASQPSMNATVPLRRFVVLWLLIVEPARADDAPRFVEDVWPILSARCIACHGSEKQEGNLRLDSFNAATLGGDRGSAIVPGDSEQSLLVQAVVFSDPDLQMPPKQKLSDREIATLTAWVKGGAVWPEPAKVLFEDERQFLAALNNGNGRGRLVADDVHSGKAALGITPLQRDGVSIPQWNFAIREQPNTGEFRFLRLAWKKRGEGSVMLELAASGRWPDAAAAQGRYVAGPNTTGWAAISVADKAPKEWTVVTIDLWQDMGDFTLTGCAPTCDRGEEAFFDMLILGQTVASLDAYRAGQGSASSDSVDAPPPGDAFSDARNPIRKLFHGDRLDLWSLKPPTRAKVPTVTTNPVDAFVRQRLAREKLAAAPPADRRTLIRRLTLDLMGLPPSPEETAEFIADRTPDAYDKLVDRLLASSGYGQRQARLWLDVVRYADTNGYERDEYRTLAWQYRDYVIRAFNADKSFDQFIREQIAGDELVAEPPQTQAEADALIATGYLRLGQWDSTASIFQEEDRLRAETMADLTNTTASAFLGLTTSCCQCHDHKYDPLSQADHYRLRAFFAGVVPRDDLVIELAGKLDEISQQNAKLDMQLQTVRAEQEKLNKDIEADKPRHAELDRRIHQLEASKQSPRVAMGVGESDALPATHVLYQGDFRSPRAEVSPGFPSVLYPGDAKVGLSHGKSSGRRLALANWIASADNPWTARVLVNRVWQQHFGMGLVATPNDLGYTGARPSHPELLDWLATEFVRDGWSLKRLHRVIVTSEAYRQTSLAADERGAVIDPNNVLLWRQNVRRLDAETLRDSLLSVAGLLRPYDSGKPLWPEVPEELLHAQPAILEAIKGGDEGRMQGWYADPLEQTDVRSVFLIRKRCLPIPFLQTFDLPDTTVSCARRDATVVAPQALMLLNSPAAIRFAEAFADRVAKPPGPLSFDADDLPGRATETIFRLALCRSPDAAESKLAIELLRRHTAQHRAAGDEQAEQRALVDLCRAVLNLNEFLYID